MLEYADEWGTVLCQRGIGAARVGAFCCVDHGYVVSFDVRTGLKMSRVVKLAGAGHCCAVG